MRNFKNGLLLSLLFIFNANLAYSVNNEPVEICDYVPNGNNRAQSNSPFSSLLSESCGCALFEVTSRCETSNGQTNIVVRVTRLGEVVPEQVQEIQDCSSFPVEVEIKQQGNVVLSVTTNLVDNAFQEFTVPLVHTPTLVFLRNGPGNSGKLVELVLSNSNSECFDSTPTPSPSDSASPTPTPSGTFTPTPTPTDTFSPSPTPTPDCGNGELVCGIEGLTNLACDSGVTSLVYNAQPQPEICDDYDYPVEAAFIRENPYEIQYSWSYNCLDSKNATVSSGNDDGTSSLQIDLTAPGEGKPTSCEVSLTVTRGEESVSCSLPAQVSACILDCNNEINGVAIFDACGECGGDGNSCGSKACETQNIAKAQITVDGSARGMARTGTRAANYLAKLVRNRSFLNELLKQMNNFYVQTWIDTWSISSNILTCTSANNLCSSVSLTTQINSVTDFGQSLFDVANKIIDKIEKRRRIKRGHFRVARKLRRQLNRYYNSFTKEIANIPSSQSVCSA